MLCMGADGHFAIEAAHGGSCKGAPCGDQEHQNDSDHEEEGCGHEDDCCGDCADVSLDLEDGTYQQASSELESSIGFVAAPVMDVNPPEPVFTSPPRPDQRHSPDHSPPLESIRTVRLLI